MPRSPLARVALAAAVLLLVVVAASMVSSPSRPSRPRRSAASAPSKPAASAPLPPPKHFSYRVVRRVPHAEDLFTEGLVFLPWNGALVEGTGLKGHTRLLMYDTDESGAPRSPASRSARLPAPHADDFGEGVAAFRDRLYQLTWKDGRLHAWDARSLQRVGVQSVPVELAEGWGLTAAPAHDALLMSEGSAWVHWVDVESDETAAKITRSTLARDCHSEAGWAVAGLNELETVPLRVTHPDEARAAHGDGRAPPDPTLAGRAPALVWSNVYGTPCVVALDPNTGDARAWVHLDGLNPEAQGHEKVPNGVAFRDADQSLWVTGKNWREMFQIELVEMAAPPGAFPGACKTIWNFPRGVLPKKKYPERVCS